MATFTFSYLIDSDDDKKSRFKRLFSWTFKAVKQL